MKNVIASAFLITVFSFYALSKSSNVTQTPTEIAVTPPISSASTTEVSSAASSEEPIPVTPTAISSTPAVAVIPKPTPVPVTHSSVPASSAPPTPPASSAAPRGMYRDGTYLSPSVDAYYGNVQIQVTVSNGTIAGVQFVDHPSGRRESDQINSYAMPTLKQEAIRSQTAYVNSVSGATYTSQAFIQALSSVVSQAKA